MCTQISTRTRVQRLKDSIRKFDQCGIAGREWVDLVIADSELSALNHLESLIISEAMVKQREGWEETYVWALPTDGEFAKAWADLMSQHRRSITWADLGQHFRIPPSILSRAFGHLCK